MFVFLWLQIPPGQFDQWLPHRYTLQQGLTDYCVRLHHLHCSKATSVIVSFEFLLYKVYEYCTTRTFVLSVLTEIWPTTRSLLWQPPLSWIRCPWPTLTYITTFWPQFPRMSLLHWLIWGICKCKYIYLEILPYASILKCKLFLHVS